MADIPVIGSSSPINWKAAAVGDVFTNDGETHLFVQNNGGTPRNVTLKSETEHPHAALDTIDRTFLAAAGSLIVVEAVSPRWYNRADGKVLVEYPDGITSLQVCAVRLPKAREK